MEAIKILANLGHPPIGRLMTYQALDSTFRFIKIKKDPQCALCSENASITEPVSYAPEETMNVLPEITTLELRQRMQQGLDGILLDVRERNEFHYARIEGCELVPLSNWPDVAAYLPKNSKYYVYCAAGVRSARAGEWMLAHGYHDVTNIAGGIQQWLAEEAALS